MAPPLTRDLLRSQSEEHGWSIGEHSYGAPAAYTLGGDARLSIGRYCSFAGGCAVLLGGGHRVDWVTTYPFSVLRPEASHIEGHPSSRGAVAIGNDVWVGQGAVIMSGVRIGDGACIAAYSVVSRDVEPYTIVGGNPARPIRARFSPEQIRALLEIAWWDWPDEALAPFFGLMLSADIDGFIAAARARGPGPTPPEA